LLSESNSTQSPAHLFDGHDGLALHRQELTEGIPQIDRCGIVLAEGLRLKIDG
jgi:hypothetical protein